MMIKYWMYLLLMLCFSPTPAFALSEEAIDKQKNDQLLCVQERTAQCIDKCKQAGMTDCAELCEETAKNECRQAGE